MTAVVAVGAATYDAIAVVAHHPRPDERLLASTVRFAGGGPAATAAVAAVRLGLPVAFVGVVGDDPEGRSVLDGLRGAGVDTAGMRVRPDRSTQSSVIVCAEDEATRVICTRAVAPLELDDAAVALVRGADWVHVDHLGWPATAAALAGVPAGERPRIVVDAGNPVPADLCDPADATLYVPTMERLRAQFGGPDPASALAACPAATVVATAGGGGAFCRGPDGTVHHAPGFAVPDLVSTLGAGDVFHGALLAAVVREMPLPDALRYANAVAALSCRGVDGREAIPTDDAVTLFLKENP